MWARTLGLDEEYIAQPLPRAMDDYCAGLEEIAALHLAIIPGTLPSYDATLHKFMKCALVFSKNGRTQHQDKINLTESNSNRI